VNYIQNTKKDSSGVAPLRQEGMFIDDTSQKAEILNKQYHSVFTHHFGWNKFIHDVMNFLFKVFPWMVYV
jgi:hypothetical protein